jgi:hypothetical protein
METVPRLRPTHGETLLAGPNESYLIGRVHSEAQKHPFSMMIKTLQPLLAQNLGSIIVMFGARIQRQITFQDFPAIENCCLSNT